MLKTLGELADSYTILSLKYHNGSQLSIEDSYNVQMQFEAHETEIHSHPLYSIIKGLVRDLYQINKEIWELESIIRQGLDNTITLEEVGRTALEIRNKNKKRVELKNKISSLEEGKIGKEIKINHASF